MSKVNEEQAAKALVALIRRTNANARKDGDPLEGHPGHCHSKPGHWDATGKPCKECKVWNEARAVANGEEVKLTEASTLAQAALAREEYQSAVRQFKEAWAFYDMCKADASDSVYETGAMRDALNWKVSASEALYRKMVELGL